MEGLAFFHHDGVRIPHRCICARDTEAEALVDARNDAEKLIPMLLYEPPMSS